MCVVVCLFVHASACVCIMRVLCCAVCVGTAGPGDPGAAVWSVGERRRGIGERPRQLYLG